MSEHTPARHGDSGDHRLQTPPLSGNLVPPKCPRTGPSPGTHKASLSQTAGSSRVWLTPPTPAPTQAQHSKPAQQAMNPWSHNRSGVREAPATGLCGRTRGTGRGDLLLLPSRIGQRAQRGPSGARALQKHGSVNRRSPGPTTQVSRAVLFCPPCPALRILPPPSTGCGQPQRSQGLHRHEFTLKKSSTTQRQRR